MSNFQADVSPAMSTGDQCVVKRRVNQDHRANVAAGYVPVDEQRLHKAGIRGRKASCFYVLIALLFLAVLANLALTLFILCTLRIGREGMESLEFSPDGDVLWFLEETEVDHVILNHNTIGTPAGSSMELTATDDQQMVLREARNNITYCSVGVSSEGVVVVSDTGLTVTNPDTGTKVFSSYNHGDRPEFPTNVDNLVVNKLETHRVTSGINKHLYLEGEKEILTSGWEGVAMDTSQLLLAAKADVNLSTTHLELMSPVGYYLDQVNSFPVTPSPLQPPVEAYKICVCHSSSHLYLVPAEHGCNQNSEDVQPCRD